MKKTYVIALLLLITGCFFACSKKKDDVDPVADVRTKLIRTWRGQTMKLNDLLLVEPIFGIDARSLSITFNNDQSFTFVGNVGVGVPTSGQWAFDNSDPSKVILTPGGLVLTINNLTTSTATFAFAAPTEGTPLTALGSLL